MQFSIAALAIFAAGALAMPSNAATSEHTLKARCQATLPACNGGHITGQTNCRCEGQVPTCDVWSCPGNGANTVMVCGQSGSGCVWI